MFIRLKGKILSRFIASVLLLLLVAWIFTSKDILVSQTQIFQVKAGSSIGEVAHELSEKKIIKSKSFFTALSKVLNANKKLKSGYYELKPNTSILNFLDKISRGDTLKTKITLIEGKTIQYYFNQLSKDPSITTNSSFDQIMNSIGVNKPFDGWFYPETYIFNYGESIENVLMKSHETMKSKLSQLWEERDKSIPLNSPYQAIILASLIENETALDYEKPLISSVFIGRLNLNMRLQTDPTVIYALGENYSPPLTRSDLQFDHPYNTYRNKGLPPGAISSVGYQSLYAALHPAKGNDLYFVAKKDGSHAFASTYDEHKENIKKYLKGN
ncbi:MAG: endolytic transglycosylase MltG [Pseudomonadota bacterium]|nr:endolytic transglycosylase MltG [Pseudomonadota bacterium]